MGKSEPRAPRALRARLCPAGRWPASLGLVSTQLQEASSPRHGGITGGPMSPPGPLLVPGPWARPGAGRRPRGLPGPSALPGLKNRGAVHGVRRAGDADVSRCDCPPQANTQKGTERWIFLLPSLSPTILQNFRGRNQREGPSTSPVPARAELRVTDELLLHRQEGTRWGRGGFCLALPPCDSRAANPNPSRGPRLRVMSSLHSKAKRSKPCVTRPRPDPTLTLRPGGRGGAPRCLAAPRLSEN